MLDIHSYICVCHLLINLGFRKFKGEGEKEMRINYCCFIPLYMYQLNIVKELQIFFYFRRTFEKILVNC